MLRFAVKSILEMTIVWSKEEEVVKFFAIMKEWENLINFLVIIIWGYDKGLAGEAHSLPL